MRVGDTLAVWLACNLSLGSPSYFVRPMIDAEIAKSVPSIFPPGVPKENGTIVIMEPLTDEISRPRKSDGGSVSTTTDCVTERGWYVQEVLKLRDGLSIYPHTLPCRAQWRPDEKGARTLLRVETRRREQRLFLSSANTRGYRTPLIYRDSQRLKIDS